MSKQIQKFTHTLSTLAVSMAILGMASASIAYAVPQQQYIRTLQTFKHPDINVKFRYIKEKLVGIELENPLKKPMTVEIMGKDYTLGPGDMLLINPPAVKYLHVHVKPHSLVKTSVDKVLPNRHSKLKVYELPETATDKSTNFNPQSQ